MCLLCPNKKEFDKCWKVRKHLEEQHSGFCYMCPTCDKTLVRRQSHLECPNVKPRDLIPMHRQTGTHGEEAARMLREYKEKQMPNQWEERLKRTPLLPTPVSPLPKTPPVKHPKDLAPASLKRPSITIKSKPKRLRLDTDDVDFRHDPVEISLEQPEEVFEVDPDPKLRHVHFPSPERLTDSESEDESPSIIMRAEDIMEISSSPQKPLENHYIPIDQNQNNNNNSRVKNSRSEPTHEHKLANKDSDKDTHGNKNEPKQVKTSEIESTHEINLVNKDGDKDTHGNKNEPKQVKTSEIESTHEINLANKDSDKDTHGNKNEPKQVKTSEIESTHEINLVNKDSDKDTYGNKNEPKQVKTSEIESTPNLANKDSDKDTHGNKNQNSVRPTAGNLISLNQQPEFPFTDTQEDGTSSDADQFNLDDLNLDVEGYHSLIRQIVKLKHPEATPYTSVQPETNVNREAVQKLTTETFNKLQQSQEGRVILNIGGQCFQTSRVTLMADPTSMFALMLRKGCPLRPSRNTYFLDRDPSHFKFILNYLRNGAHVDICMLPHEKRYLLEMLMESRFYMLSGLEDIILARLKQVTGCDKY